MVKNCKTCGKSFHPNNTAHRYCSPVCWASVSEQYLESKRAKSRVETPKRPGPKPDLQKRATIHALREAGLTYREIAARLGISRQAACEMALKIKTEQLQATG